MQRLGRAVRDKSLRGRGILIAEAKCYDDEIEKQRVRDAKKESEGAKPVKRVR